MCANTESQWSEVEEGSRRHSRDKEEAEEEGEGEMNGRRGNTMGTRVPHGDS